MAAETYLLDSSALLTLIEDEPGADRVEEVLRTRSCLIPWLALLEVYYITQQEKGVDESEYRYALLQSLSAEILWEADTSVLRVAAAFKAEHRVSLADAIMASFAKTRAAVLLHKDPDFLSLEARVALESCPTRSLLDSTSPAPAARSEVTMDSDYDVIVIGAGPAGSAMATLVADAGHRVLALERETFPRFKIGESLIPATFEALDRLGLIDELKASHFPKKYSVQFFSGDGRASAPFYFSETEPENHSQTWQVLRSELDQMLVDNARRHGVEVRHGVAVKEVLFDGERAVGVRVQESGGPLRDLRCRVVADASGQRAVLARQLRIRRQDPCLRMAAIFTHFEGAQRDPGIDEGATLILQTEGQKSWFWYIPLPEDRVSVGVVGPIDHLVKGRQGDPQKVFDEELARCPGLKPRVADARQAMDVQVLNDFSYSATRAAGDGWVLVGDAFTFLDPIYSSGVLLAFASAELAADAVVAALAAGDPSAARLGVYEPRMRRGVDAFRKLVYAFYTPEFNFGRFLRRYPEHREPIIKILVGDVFDRDFGPFFRDVDAFTASVGATLPQDLPALEQSVA